MLEEELLQGRDSVLSFPINFSSVLTHLRQDMKDDWFFDAINYEDLLSDRKHLEGVITSLLEEGNGRYLGSKRTLFDIPKKGYGIRYSLETDFYDRFVYQAICSFLIPYYDPLLSNRVFGHRHRKKSKRDRYLFKSRIDLWSTFEGVTLTAFKAEKTLLATDLINYFENITVSSVREAFERKISYIKASGREKLYIRNAIATLCDLLAHWSYSDRHGLPQNRDASSFIANVVLSDVDRRMVAKGYDYFRYVDDIRIICESPQHARKAITDLISELRTVGMNINSAKTEILTSSTDTEIINSFFPGHDDRVSAINQMWRSKSRRIIIRSIPYIYQILEDCIEKKETQSRQFRFAVNRFTTLIESKLFDASSQMAHELIELVLTKLDEQAASSDQFCRLLASLELQDEHFEILENHLKNDEISIHGWQNYNLWLLLARKKKRTDELVSIAKDKITRRPDAAEIPAIFIYLCCIGAQEELTALTETYSADWPYIKRRYFLLSVSNATEDDRRPLISKLCYKTKGTINRALPYYQDGLPLRDRDVPNMLDIYEQLDPYE